MKKTIRRKFSNEVSALEVVDGIDLSGKTFMVTGATSGIGFETAKALALEGAHVVMACRNLEQAEIAKEKILTEAYLLTGGHSNITPAKVSILHLNCRDLCAVERCVAEFRKGRWDLDCLILNAGVYKPPQVFTAEGYEATFQINYLAQFYLAQLLLPQLRAAAPSRIVVVSSSAHSSARLSPKDVNREVLSPRDQTLIPSPYTTYAMSKLCNILFANEFNRRYSYEGITASSIHPGIIRTNMNRNSSLGRLFLCCCRCATKTPAQGAATAVYAATAEELTKEGGQYFVRCQSKNPSPDALNPKTAERLWEFSEDLIALAFINR